LSERSVASARARAGGFTLIETIAAIVVLAVVMGLASRVIFAAGNAYTASAIRSRLTSDMTVAMERLELELRNIPAEAGSSPAVADISAVGASSITFGGGGLSVSGSSLVLTPAAGGSAVTILNGVTSLDVQTYDASGTALGATLSGTGCDAIRQVEVTVTASRAGVSRTMRTRVCLRSLVELSAP
jgi:prepilin-type N-terminal cleavage/methylation domain-containing protein